MGLKINLDLLPMKAHYFLWNAGTAPLVPFMSVYARQLGFSSVVVGIIYTILPFSGMLAKPLMGAMADRFKCQKVIFLLSQLVGTIAFMAMIFLPSVPVTTISHINFACDNSEVAMHTCNYNNDSCTIDRLLNDESNDQVLCKLNCPLKSNHWETVCQYWHGEEYCSTSTGNLSFTAHIPLRLTDQIGECIYFRVKNVTFENGKTTYPNCPTSEQAISTICDIECDSHLINDVAKIIINDENIVYLYQFWILLTVYLIAWIGQAITVSIGDTICFQLLDDKPHKYGLQRMYGALGWGVFSIISGVLVDFFSNGAQLKNYGPVFGIGIGILLLCIIVSSRIRYTQQSISTNILRDVGHLLKNLQIFIFLLWCICVGLCTALMWNFLFWLLEDLAKLQGCDTVLWIKTIEGLVMGIQCLGGELPFFFLSSFIIKRIGHVNAMSLVLLVIGFRFIFYSVLTNPWWSLPIEFCNGLTFGLFYATMASYASIIAPPGTEATMQGLVGAVFEGVGVSLGSFIAGILMKEVGGSKTFRIFGIAALVACLLHAGVQFLIRKCNKEDKDGRCTLLANQKRSLANERVSLKQDLKKHLFEVLSNE